MNRSPVLVVTLRLVTLLVLFAPVAAWAGPSGAAAPGMAASEGVAVPPIILDRSEFGIWYVDPRGEQVFAPTTLVPLTPGTAFGWRIRIVHPMDTVTLTEKLTLPSAPLTWGNIDSSFQRISRDRRSCISTTRTAAGWYERSWSVAEGDPAGEHRITVQANGRTVATYRFWVIPRPPQGE